MYLMKELKRSSFGSPWTMKPDESFSGVERAVSASLAAIASRSSPRAFRRLCESFAMRRRSDDEGHIAGDEGCADQFCEGVEEERVFFVELDGMVPWCGSGDGYGTGTGASAGKAMTRTHVSDSPESQDSKYTM